MELKMRTRKFIDEIRNDQDILACVKDLPNSYSLENILRSYEPKDRLHWFTRAGGNDQSAAENKENINDINRLIADSKKITEVLETLKMLLIDRFEGEKQYIKSANRKRIVYLLKERYKGDVVVNVSVVDLDDDNSIIETLFSEMILWKDRKDITELLLDISEEFGVKEYLSCDKLFRYPNPGEPYKLTAKALKVYRECNISKRVA